MATMSLSTRREYLMRIKKKYLKADKEQKSNILNEFCDNSGMHRKYVIALLQARMARHAKVGRQREPRKPAYDNRVMYWLKKIWDILDCPCGQRLAPVLADT